MALNGVGIVSADKPATLRIFTEGLGLSFQHWGEGGEQGQHSEAETAGVKLMVDTVDVIKKFNPDYQFSPESCTVHLTFKCDKPSEVDEIFGKVKASGASVEKEPFDAFWKQRYSTLRDPGSGVIHLLLLIFVVPLGDTSLPVKGQDTIRYQQVAAAEPCNWFSANPVHCLRSKHIHRDDPPSSFFTPGQESTMQINEAIGCFFSAKAAKVENASDFEIRLPAALRGRWNCALPAMTFWKKAEDGTSDPPS
eukprot:s93_g37.t1